MARKLLSSPRLPLGPLRVILRSVQARLPELNFITLHYAYFILTSLLSALVFWGSADPFRSVSFIDSLFLTTSAMTEAGLNTVNLSELNTWQQVMLFLLIIMGSAIFVSAFVLFVRLKAFEKAFTSLKKDRLDRRLRRRQTGFSRTKSFLSLKSPKLPTFSASASIDNPTRGRLPSKDVIENPSLDEERKLGYGPDHFPEEELGQDEAAEDQNRFKEAHQTSIQHGKTEVHEDDLQSRVRSQSLDDRGVDRTDNQPDTPHIGFGEGTRFQRRTDEEYGRLNKPLISFTGVGAVARASIRLRSRSASAARPPSISRAAPLPGPHTTNTNAYFTSGGWISRNSQFHGLSKDERLLLGGCEYKAVVFLSLLVPLYFVLWQLLGAIACGAWVAYHRGSLARANGFSPWWVGSFNAVSAFNNSGMSLLDANMVAFQDAIFLLLSMGLFILAGNTAYPIFLRAIVWTIWKLIPDDDPNWLEDKKTLRFLLDHPRRVYTNMFPSRQTWWLAAVLVALNGIDWAFFPILNIGNHAITYLSPGIEAIDGLFQALAVRSGGFYVVPIPSTRLSLQFLYAVMMFISAFPVAITMRNSNVYEERSLGVYAEDIENEGPTDDEAALAAGKESTPNGHKFHKGLRRRLTDISEKAAPAPQRETRSYFVRQQIRAQLSHDAWFLVFAVFLILIIEASQLEAHPVTFSVFNVIFEVVSGYATVGISVGVPNDAYSFSGSWHTLSKLVLIIVMIRGRHRGLPVAIDHAVQLPGAHLYQAEIEDGEKRLDKRESYYASRSPDPLSPKATTRIGPTPILRNPRPMTDPSVD